MGKKLSVWIIAVALVAVMIAGYGLGVVDEAFGLEGENANVHLVQPTDIEVNDNGIFIADNVEIDGQPYTALHKLAGDYSTRKTYYFAGRTTKLYAQDIQFYLMQGDKLLNLGYDANNDKFLTAEPTEYGGMVDFAVTEGYLYILYPTKLVRISGGNAVNITTTLTDAKAMIAINGTLYVQYGDKYISFSNKDGVFSPSEPQELPKGYSKMCNLLGRLCFFEGNTAMDLNGNTMLVCENNIVTAKMYGNRAYVLSDKNKVTQYFYDADKLTFVKADATEIGSTSVNKTVPSSFFNYTLATAYGYPSNILYEASKSDKSVHYRILGKNERFLILDYDGSSSSSFYLVFYQGKFGWIEKTSEVTTERIERININVNAKGQTVSTTHVYSLPYYDENGTYSVDSIGKGTKLTLHKKLSGLTADNDEWYYVTYEKGDQVCSGFVRTGLITNVQETSQQQTTALGRFTVNAKLTNQLPVYTDKTLTTQLKTDSGEQFFLKSGQNVVVIEQSEDKSVALIQATINDHIYSGYVESSYLIKKGLTDYTALGLMLLLVAVLIVVFVVIINKRKKSGKSAPTDSDNLDDKDAVDGTVSHEHNSKKKKDKFKFKLDKSVAVNNNVEGEQVRTDNSRDLTYCSIKDNKEK